MEEEEKSGQEKQYKKETRSEKSHVEVTIFTVALN